VCYARSPAASGMIEQAILTTDGACIRNPGPVGGLTCFVISGHVTNLSGTNRTPLTTEWKLRAVIEGCVELKRSRVVSL